MKRLFPCMVGLSVGPTLQLFIASTIFLPVLTHGAPPPSAQQILASVRMVEARQQIDLQGQLRENEIVIPFHLTQNGPLIRYSFTNPDEILQLRLGQNSSRLDFVTDTGTEKFAAGKTSQKNRGNRPTYLKLAF